MLTAALSDISDQICHAPIFLLEVYPYRGLLETETGSSFWDLREDSHLDFYQSGQK
jgi:hypothetical protein